MALTHKTILSERKWQKKSPTADEHWAAFNEHHNDYKNIDNIENMSCCSIKISLESNNLVRKWISEEPKIKC